jgi:uroporphyrinogen-III synthase
LRLLVTRPEPDAEETAARLVALGHEAVVQPMLRVHFAPPPEVPPEPVAIIATSRNGVRALVMWPFARAWRDRPLFVTGKGTASAARAAGFADVRPGGVDAASVADRLTGEVAPDAGPLLYVAGRDRTGALAGGLSAIGYRVAVIEAYRAEPVAALDPAVAAALAEGRIDGILLFSQRTTEAFLAAVDAAGLRPALAATPCYAISPRAAEPIRGVARDIRVAAHPDFDGIAMMIGAEGPQLA